MAATATGVTLCTVVGRQNLWFFPSDMSSRPTIRDLFMAATATDVTFSTVVGRQNLWFFPSDMSSRPTSRDLVEMLKPVQHDK